MTCSCGMKHQIEPLVVDGWIVPGDLVADMVETLCKHGCLAKPVADSAGPEFEDIPVPRNTKSPDR